MPSLIDRLDTPGAPQTELVETCPLCKSKESEFLFWNCDRLHQFPGKFGLVQCNECELVRLSPRPTRETIGSYYPSDYYIYQEPTVSVNSLSQRNGVLGWIRDGIRHSVIASLGYPVDLKVWQKIGQPLFVKLFKTQGTYGWEDRFPQYMPDGQALDIGCGNGTFLSFLKHWGWNVRGVEMDSQAADTARKCFGIDVFQGGIEDAPLVPDSFDYINISHILEHIHDPVSFIKKAGELLKPGGTMYVEVPNYESAGRKVSGQFWFPYETPRHLYIFAPSTLRNLFEQAGLIVMRLDTRLENWASWNVTYELEEILGDKINERPSTAPENAARAKALTKLVREGYKRDRESGDAVECWLTKE